MASTTDTCGHAATNPAPASRAGPMRYALLGNPNAGKTTLFNRLCGLRARTANFPGSTFDARIGSVAAPGARYEIVDLPGHYGLNLDRPESRLCREYLGGRLRALPRPDAVLVVADATNLARHLIFASQALQQALPAVVVLTRIDVAQRQGLTIDAARLGERLGCPVVPVNAVSGAGIDALVEALAAPRLTDAVLADPTSADAAAAWADGVVAASVGGHGAVGSASDTLTDRLDAAFTHPVLGTLVFAAVMGALFWSIFALAAVPMDLIELAFAHLGSWAGALLPAGALRDLVAEGVVGGIAGTLVFLPQICLLFFFISLLEDSGYLARAAFVMDRLMRRFGLPGQSFVPMLSAHACAIPAIMSARLIPDSRDRLATILVAPFLSCSARLPVYVLLIGILFGDAPLLAGIAFAGCYALGAAAALLTALLFRSSILRGASAPMILELPDYKMPSLRTAALATFDRGSVFLRKAGTVILAICIVLWWLGEYPKVEPPAEAAELRDAARAIAAAEPERAAALESRAFLVEAKHAKAGSFIGILGRAAEPVFAPIGCDWQLSVGVLSSFLAREVFVSTMSIVLTGDEGDPAEDTAVRERIVGARRSDGSPLFTAPTAASLLVFYVLAMQCLPTLAVTRRETGSWKWPALQLGWMSVIAYGAALLLHGAMVWFA